MERRNGSSLGEREQARQLAWQRACREVSARGVRPRCRVARELADCGAAAVEPLCGALLDPNLKVRRTAARSLAAIGDASAVPPLRQALQGTMLGGGAATHRVGGWMTLASLCAGQVAFATHSFLQGTHRLLAVAALCLYWALSLTFYVARGWANNRADLRAALVAALAEIAARDGGPEARSSLPELESLARTPFARDNATRKELERALEVIRMLPEALPLPIPAARNAETTADLPLVSERSVSALPAASLPRPEMPGP